MSAKYMSQQALCDAIFSAVFQSEKPLSRRDISDAIGRKKAPHIIAMIEHLATTGYFKKATRIDEFGREGFIYSATRKNAAAACSGDLPAA